MLCPPISQRKTLYITPVPLSRVARSTSTSGWRSVSPAKGGGFSTEFQGHHANHAYCESGIMSPEWHKVYASLRSIAVALLLGFLLTTPPPTSPVFAHKLQPPEKNAQAGQEYTKAPCSPPTKNLIHSRLPPFSCSVFLASILQTVL